MLSRKSTKVWVPKLMKHTDKTLMRINIYMQMAQMDIHQLHAISRYIVKFYYEKMGKICDRIPRMKLHGVLILEPVQCKASLEICSCND